MKKTVICDIDGVLCENTRVHYHLKLSYYKEIEALEKLYLNGYMIVLFTSRKSRYRKQTLWWLRRNNVRYHKLIMDKPKGDFYVDDKSFRNVPDLVKVIKRSERHWKF